MNQYYTILLFFNRCPTKNNRNRHNCLLIYESVVLALLHNTSIYSDDGY